MTTEPEMGSPEVHLEATFGALSRKRNRVRVLRDDAGDVQGRQSTRRLRCSIFCSRYCCTTRPIRAELAAFKHALALKYKPLRNFSEARENRGQTERFL